MLRDHAVGRRPGSPHRTLAPAAHSRRQHPGAPGPDHAPQRAALGPRRGVLCPAAEITERALIDGIYRHISTSN
ncbi:hypothetical protein EMIT051CA3_40454 [Pseudomonas chlororaphis]